jgi:hypothetical protein
MLIRQWMVVLMLHLAFLAIAVGDRVRAELGMTSEPAQQVSFTASD